MPRAPRGAFAVARLVVAVAGAGAGWALASSGSGGNSWLVLRRGGEIGVQPWWPRQEAGTADTGGGT
jgi:hypothetical protein